MFRIKIIQYTTDLTLHCRLSLCLYHYIQRLKPLTQLSVDEVETLLQRLNFGEFAAAFKQQNIDGKQLQFLETPDDLKDCSISMPRIKARALIADVVNIKAAGGLSMDMLVSKMPLSSSPPTNPKPSRDMTEIATATVTPSQVIT